MVNNSAYFDNLIISCSLIGNKAVVPSLLEFRNHLQLNIQKLIDELKNKHYSETLVDAFCRLTCVVLDTNINKMLAAVNMRWLGYELATLFYGTDQQKKFTTDHEALLLSTKNSEIATYANILFAMSPDPKLNKGLATSTFRNDNNILYQNHEILNDNVILENYHPTQTTTLPQIHSNSKFTKRVVLQVIALLVILVCLWLIGLVLHCGEYL